MPNLHGMHGAIFVAAGHAYPLCTLMHVVQLSVRRAIITCAVSGFNNNGAETGLHCSCYSYPAMPGSLCLRTVSSPTSCTRHIVDFACNLLPMSTCPCICKRTTPNTRHSRIVRWCCNGPLRSGLNLFPLKCFAAGWRLSRMSCVAQTLVLSLVRVVRGRSVGVKPLL